MHTLLRLGVVGLSIALVVRVLPPWMGPALPWVLLAAAAAIGWSARDLLPDLVAGMVVLFERRIRPGVWISGDDFSGTVVGAGLRATWVVDARGHRIAVPNRRLLSGPIVSDTAFGAEHEVTLRMDVPALAGRARLDALSERTGCELWVKRDDLTGTAYGGNKVRKLEYLLGEARTRGAECLVTAGALGSHHVLATAIYAPRIEVGVHAVLVPQPWNEHVEENLRCALGAGAELHGATTFGGAAARMLKLTAKLRLTGERPYAIPQGGSSPTGAVAYAAAGLELAAQIDRGELPEPEAVYVALGSGGTAVGMAIGLAAAGVTVPVVGVRVTDRLFINRTALSALTKGTVHRLRGLDPRFPSVASLAMRHLRIDGTEFGPGYGHPTPEAEEALRVAEGEAGLHLDLTYTGKAFAAMLRDAGVRGRTLLFWNTLSGVDLSDRLRAAPPTPRWARHLGEKR